MGYKVILAHCNDKERLGRLLDSAVALSAAFGARLVGVSVSPPMAVIPAGMPSDPNVIVIDERAKAYRAENPTMKAAFERAAHERDITAEWREEDAGSSSVARTVVRHARSADLVIASQTASEWKGSLHLDIADRLALESGRPVVIVPNKGSHHPIPKRIVVGWTDTREATRAVFDALPLLRRADRVTVVEVDPESGRDAAGNRGALCATLTYHGVTCEADATASRHGDVADALLACCERTKADLLVVGCYGHSRVREFVLGGTSRHLLRNMTLPLLMSH